MSTYNKDDYEWYKTRNLCPRCRRNNAACGMTLCADCIFEAANRDIRYGTAKKTELAKARRERLKALGLCVRCGKNPPVSGITVCKQCQKKYNAKNRLWYRENYVRTVRPDGICRFCDSPVVPGKKLCAEHMVSETAKLDKARAEGKCDTSNHIWRTFNKTTWKK